MIEVPDPWLVERLICPVERQALSFTAGGLLATASGRTYPVVEGLPVLLTDAPDTVEFSGTSRQLARTGGEDRYYVATVGVSAEEAQGIRESLARGDGSVDPVVSYLVGATNGIAYKHLVGKLKEYPIPDIRLPPGGGRTLLDIGGSWGRWSLAAARKGYVPVVIDPSLGAVLAARRVFRQLGLVGHFVVGDARHLPFGDGTFDMAYSYSVIQHFSRQDAGEAVSEIGRVLKPGGESLVQMPTALGVRCLMHQARRGFREPREFEVRYSTLPALKRLFTSGIGPTWSSVDCYFGIGLQRSDLRHMTVPLQAVVVASEGLRGISRVFPPLKYVADSVFLRSRKPADLAAQGVP